MKLNRRQFLKKAAQSSSCLVVAPLVLSACRKNNNNVDSKSSLNAKEFLEDHKPCPKDDSLTPEILQRRTILGYVDKTTRPHQTCDNCKLYTIPRTNSHCGGCKILPGPIHPKGWCKSWYRLM